MKKLYSILALALVFTTAASANALFESKAKDFNPNSISKKETKAKIKKASIKDDELITPPESAVIETNWTLSGTYVNNSTGYTNGNDILVAFDGNDVYIQGVAYLCPEGWIKGTIDGEEATFANGQYVGIYDGDNIYACGTDGDDLTDIYFQYDAASHVFTIANYYLENTAVDDFSFYFYCADMVIARGVCTPLNVEATPDETSASLSWKQDDEAAAWNIRYRATVEKLNRLYTFEDEEDLEGWRAIDADGDGFNWYHAQSEGTVAHSGTGVLTSASWVSGTVLTPDNWLITPPFDLGAQASFWYVGQDPSYANENFAVYLLEAEDFESVEEFKKISDDIVATGEYQQKVIDLSAYSGKGRLAIRHYNSSDVFRLNIDDFKLDVPGGQDANAWIVKEGVTENPYNLEGLAETTEYEAQVQAVIGESVSSWSEKVIFTTGENSVEGVIADKKADNVWFNLLGVRLNGQPTQAGIYINNGKKVIVK